MDRRDFLKGTALAASAGLAQITAAAPARRQFLLENQQLAWQLESTESGIRSTGFENRLSGRHFTLQPADEFALVFSAGQRIEIPWWNSRLTDDSPELPRQEAGWHPVRNLAGGQRGRSYAGYGWFRHDFQLPEPARGRDIVFVLGGYDEQDWKEHWVFVNSQEIGHRAVAERWRTPGRYLLRSTDAGYASLQFGSQSKNTLAVRTRGYDFHSEGLSQQALDQYVFRPFLFDQLISIGDPYLRVSRFDLQEVHQQDPEKISFVLNNADHNVRVTAHFELDGFVRRKWLEVHNQSGEQRLLLDIELDHCAVAGRTTEGGHGKPVFLDDELFFAVEHPAGVNQGTGAGVHLWHCPGRTIPPRSTLKSLSAVVGASRTGLALEQFHRYLEQRSPRRHHRRLSIFTCFGINNQWGACPTLSDTEALDCQRVIQSWQPQGVKLDFFTLDTGWTGNDGDLTEFAPACFPEGPGKIVAGVNQLGMKFGLWFSVSYAGWANGSYPPIQPSAIPSPGESGPPPTEAPVTTYRNGFPTNGGIGRQMCMASDPFVDVFKNALVHHVGHNKARLLKFDSGNYYCNSTTHQHLPGKYSTEAMFDNLIDAVGRARALAPDVVVIWYWGAGSPFWALHGDLIAESGLFMEGSGTSWFPALYYRDSVTLSLDQNTQFAKLIPPTNKDSLGIWLSQIRWANFMGRERWRESLVMDLGRGNLVFPQLWGDPNLLNADDIGFLARIIALARDNEAVFLKPRRTFGDSWKNEPYGYGFFDGPRGFVFCNNVHFTPRKIRLSLGREIGPAGSPLRVVSHFPEKAVLQPENGGPIRAGASLEFWMRPFETLLLEIGSKAGADLPRRGLAATDLSDYGTPLALSPAAEVPWMELKFADAARFETARMRLSVTRFSSRLPHLRDGRYVLAIVVSLQQGDRDYRYSPFVAEIVQIRAKVNGRDMQLMPVPDARQYGNTQHAGCSWVLYKIPLAAARHSGQPLEFAVHSYLPSGVTARTEAWVTRQWWQEGARPQADGFYGDAPS